jgi:hypothetical protein
MSELVQKQKRWRLPETAGGDSLFGPRSVLSWFVTKTPYRNVSAVYKQSRAVPSPEASAFAPHVILTQRVVGPLWGKYQGVTH